jgi:superfamily II DNA helicase RecQ
MADAGGNGSSSNVPILPTSILDALEAANTMAISHECLDLVDRLVFEEFQLVKESELATLSGRPFRALSESMQKDDEYIEKLLICREKTVESLLARLLSDRAGGVGFEIPPKRLQVLVLVRLLFARRDVLLVAQTGFGKSLIFQTIGLLTGQITIIIVPLLGLCDQVRDDIADIPGSLPIVISSETRRMYAKKDTSTDIYNHIRTGGHTHIILGPEQLVVPKFRALVQDPNFRERIRAVVVDEAHCVSLWSSFRTEYAQIHAFRRILSKSTVMFACTATLNPSLQMQLVQKIGLDQRPEWNNRQSIIRTSVDRADISIITVALPASTLFAGVLFSIRVPISIESQQANKMDKTVRADALLDMLRQVKDQHGDNYHSSLVSVDMTVIFANTRAEVRELKEYIREYLVSFGCPPTTAGFIVKSYTSKTGKRDREYICSEMKKGMDSAVKILVATSAFGMGLNILDIQTVVQFRGARFNPLSKISGDLMVADLWQRGGRAARRKGLTGFFYICVESDMVRREDRWRRSALNQHQSALGRTAQFTQQANKGNAKRFEVDMSTASQHGSDIDDLTDLEYKENSDGSSAEGSCIEREEDVTAAVVQIPQDIKSNRKSLIDGQRHHRDNFSWSALLEASCKRQYLLRFLGEDEFKEEEGVVERIRVFKQTCCNGCNAELQPVSIEFPRQSNPTRPQSSSIAGVMLQFVSEWAKQEAQVLVQDQNNGLECLQERG